MGMDVYGKNEGAHFRRSNWGWRPLAEYVTTQHPDITAGCTYWQSNDGDGLDADAALCLAAALCADIDSGRAAAYMAERDAYLAALPREQCHICQGSGRRTRDDDRRLIPDMVARGHWVTPEEGAPCNGCGGRGSVDNRATAYPLDIETIQEFADFCDHSGGFSIC